jgi:hypothetical protein
MRQAAGNLLPVLKPAKISLYASFIFPANFEISTNKNPGLRPGFFIQGTTLSNCRYFFSIIF